MKNYYLKNSIAKDSGLVPNLSVSVGLPDCEAPFTLELNERAVTVGACKIPDIPSCSLLLKDDQAISALCSSDVQALLHSICKGTCVLNGQVEAFIWLIGRMVDQQRETKKQRSHYHSLIEA